MILGELARRIEGELVGSEEVEIVGVGDLSDGRPGEVLFIEKPELLAQVEQGRAAAVIVPLAVKSSAKPVIRCTNPRLAFARVLALFAPSAAWGAGVHPSALVAENARLGDEVSIGPYSVIGEDAVLGDRVKVGAHSYVGRGARLSDDCTLHPRVVISDRVELGRRVIVHPGAVIGADGFGYARTEQGLHKIPQIGTVVIGDDVEVGANVTIDRATTRATIIGRGTKIDNLVQVGHNVIIGEDCVLAGQVGVSGSVRLGDRVMLAGQVGIADHVTIGSDAQVCAQAGVIGDVPAGQKVSGYPARSHREQMRAEAALHKLPDLLKQVRALQHRIEALEKGKTG